MKMHPQLRFDLASIGISFAGVTAIALTEVLHPIIAITGWLVIAAFTFRIGFLLIDHYGGSRGCDEHCIYCCQCDECKADRKRIVDSDG